MVTIGKKHKSRFIVYSFLLFLIISAAAVAFGISQRENIEKSILAKEWGEKLPKNVKVSNQTTTGFTVSWTTDVPTYGVVKLANNPKGRLIYAADTAPAKNHSVAVDGLLPYSPYSFTVNSDNFAYGKKTNNMLLSLGVSGNIRTENSFRAETLPPEIPGSKPALSYQEYLEMNKDKLNKPFSMESAVFRKGDLNAKFVPMTAGGGNKVFNILKEPAEKLQSPIIIVIEKELLDPLMGGGSGVLSRYIQEQSGEGHDSVVWTYDGKSPDEFPKDLISKIKSFYETNGDIYYMLLIGDIPAKWAAKETNSKYDRPYPSDIFYMDPYSKCIDDNSDGVCEKRAAGPDGSKILFPVARLPRPTSSVGDTVTLLRKYFQKYFDYSNNQMNLKDTNHISNWPGQATLYSEEEMKLQQTLERIVPPEKYFRKNTYFIVPQPKAAKEYVEKMITQPKTWLFTIMSVHSNSTLWGFDSPPPDAPDNWEFITSDDLINYKPNSYFYNNRGCSTGTYLINSDEHLLSLTQLYNLPKTIGVKGNLTWNTLISPELDIDYYKVLSEGSDGVSAMMAYYNQNRWICDYSETKLRDCSAHENFLGIPTFNVPGLSNFKSGCEARGGMCTSE